MYTYQEYLERHKIKKLTESDFDSLLIEYQEFLSDSRLTIDEYIQEYGALRTIEIMSRCAWLTSKLEAQLLLARMQEQNDND